MNWLETSHEVLAFLVPSLWLLSMLFLVLRKRGKDFDWLAFAGLGIFVVLLAVDLFFINRDVSGGQKLWSRGWILPKGEDGSITIGIIEDSLGLAFSILAAVLAAALLSSRCLFRKDETPERTRTGALMAVAGVAVSWMSLTPWFSILGMMIAALGGVIALGANRGRDLIAQFGRERTWGFALAFVGVAVLSGGRAALALNAGFALSSRTLPAVFDVIGGIVFLFGIFFFLQPLPFSDWLTRAPRVSSPSSLIVAQILSALAAFALLTRFEPVLRSIGVLEIFQWLALASAILGAFSGLAQENWKTALPIWVSSVNSLAFASLCFSGPGTALPILIGASLSGSSLALLASASEVTVLGERAKRWRVILGVASAAPGLGFIGFVTCGGYLQTLLTVDQDPARLTVFSLALTAATILLWKCVFSGLFSKERNSADSSAQNSIAPILSASALILLSLGLLWSGTLSGGAIPGDADRLFPSWLDILLGAKGTGVWSGDITLAETLFWSLTLISTAVSIWLFGRNRDRIVQAYSGSPKFHAFIRNSYAVRKLGNILLAGVLRIGNFFETWINEKVSGEWIPRGVENSLRMAARWIDFADQKSYLKEESVLRQWVDVPAKTLQVVQNGDLQWYVVFAVGCVAAILIHFLRF